MPLESSGIKIVKLLVRSGGQAFFVGGYVRDQLLGRKSDNLDIATSLTPDEVEKVLTKAKIKYKTPGKQFGTILILISGQKIEITTFRSEGRYSNKRHPDQVEFIRDYLQDAKRRDFTINALYFDPIGKKLYDPAKGINDLGLKLIRFVGDPRKRIDEDALRMLRGVRLAAQLGFKLEKNTFAAMKTRAKYVQQLNDNQIKKELGKILDSKNKNEGLELLAKTGLKKFLKNL